MLCKRGCALAPREIGCFLLHYGVWERLVETGTPCALVLEANALLDNGFAVIVDEAMKVADEWDVAYLAALDGCRWLVQCCGATI